MRFDEVLRRVQQTVRSHDVSYIKVAVYGEPVQVPADEVFVS